MTPWTEACQASLSITISRSLLKLMSIELVMPSNHLIVCNLFTVSWCGLNCPPKDISSVQFSQSVMFNSLRPHGLQHASLSCPSPTPGACSNSCPSSQWCHLTISSSVVPFSSCPQSFPASVFSNESALHIRWSKYWSFNLNISPSDEHPGLIWMVRKYLPGCVRFSGL